MTTKRLQVYGMVCYACTDILENAVKEVPGVRTAEVNYMTDTMLVRYEETLTDLERIQKAAAKAGYKLEEEETDARKRQGRRLRQKRKKNLRRKILLVFTCSLLLNSLQYLLPDLVTLFLATVVQVVVVKEFYKDAGNGIASKKGNMSLLIAIGTTAGYLYSVYAVIRGKGENLSPCFDNLAAIVTMVLIGRFIELGTRMESGKSIRKLFQSRTETARVLQEGEEICLKVMELCPGMEIRIKSGEKAPIDSKLLEGSVSVDESILTGEYFPIEKAPGDSITGGSYVIRGSALCRVEKKLEETYFYQLLEDASLAMSGKKIAVITVVDRILEYFVPGVLLVAVFTLFFWYGAGKPGDLQKAAECSLAVLLTACPCALGLAVPLSVIHTVGCAAAHGIFIREEGKLEQLGKAEKIVFDKTGTLTEGRISSKDSFESEDTLRGEAYRAIEQLKALGLTIAILSGDREENVTKIGGTLKIETVYSGLSPEDKADWIEHGGDRIIMVGDGINDLPGMLKSQIGITLNAGCGAVQDCADLVIGSNRLDRIPEMIRLSRAMNRNIRQNLLGSFLYNTVGIIMAVSGMLSPLLAGFAMSLSSVGVMWNANRMKKIGNKILENS